ncbi:MAG: leucine-rich repeat domain-containing protein, partial [Paludibacteraceae bacterium]|nr:leucine-rich repeat domain-containing protein [Paludibacteraceae bacterium]
PEGVTSIGDNAFTGCKSLTRIKIPENVTSIGKEAFYGCRNLNVLIDNSKEKVEIGEDAFEGCKSVKFLK